MCIGVRFARGDIVGLHPGARFGVIEPFAALVVKLRERILLQHVTELCNCHLDRVVTRLLISPPRCIPRNCRHLIKRQLAASERLD